MRIVVERAVGIAFAHEVRACTIFALFVVVTTIQLGPLRTADWKRLMWAAVASLTMGALVELAEGVTGYHTCRMRDLIPDLVGILLGVLAAALWRRLKS